MSLHPHGFAAPKAARCLPLLSLPALAALTLALPPRAAVAQNQFDPVVVVGTREPQPLSRSTADVTVISAGTLQTTTADSLEDLLRREVGMQITRNGGPGQTSGYFLRGAGSNGSVVLIDGVRVGSATLGYAELESMNLSQIDHIEVLRGPASSLYGADAVGGVVQIFTRRGGSPRVTGGAAVGGHRSSEADLGLSGSQGGFDYAASLGRESSRGVSSIRPNDHFGLYNPDDDGYTRNSGNLRLGYSPAAGHRLGINLMETRLNSHYDDAQYLAPDYTPDPSPDFRSHLDTRLASVDYRGDISPLWTTTLQWAQNVDDLRSGGRALTRYETRRDQATWQNALHFTADQQLVVGYEYLKETVGGDLFSHGPARRNHAAILGYSGHFGAQGLEASLRRDSNSAYGSNTTGSLGYAYDLTPEWKLRAVAGTTFRAPTFNDLYYPQYGLPTIEPERGRSVELGAAWQSGNSRASATVYRNTIRHLIVYDPDPNGTDCPTGYFGCASNVGQARLQGATLTAAQRWGGLDVQGSVDFLDAKDAATGVRLTRRAAHQESLAADYTVGLWRVGGSLLDVGARPDGIRLGGYSVLDLRVDWRVLPTWRLEAKLLNALDHRIEPVRDYQGLGRQAWIGIRFDGSGV